MIVPCEKRQFRWGQCIFLVEKHKLSKETYILKLFVIIIMSYLFLYWLATHQWKGFEDSCNFVVENYTFVPWCNLCPFLLKDQLYAWGSNSLGEQPCSIWEKMCLKLCVNIIFSYELWLKCFQLQSYTSPWDLSNDRLQT